MRKIFFSSLIVFILLGSSYLYYHFKINDNEISSSKAFELKFEETKGKYYQTLRPKDLNPKSFIKLFKEKYNKNSKLNFVTMLGDFPENWVKPNDVQYLISIMNSKEKCCGYMNTFSSFISSENGEVGGFAIIFLNSYISKKQINMGLNCNPKTDKESVRKIENWYRNTKK
ncbi:hypothetical protein [Flavobacterium sp. KACC 22761]|uniref:hypothetical protein n=1 Tax=Flavobacterium sp. KACC 22761 TaxID=3092665 RepID=UPI002A74BF77|nr:hypothetical protein [Flavobacterium sp. KACC 22761]WPO79131.1 hypothetical protein SCB73_01815 [Flavobacterium sp. KACC 22761]